MGCWTAGPNNIQLVLAVLALVGNDWQSLASRNEIKGCYVLKVKFIYIDFYICVIYHVLISRYQNHLGGEKITRPLRGADGFNLTENLGQVHDLMSQVNPDHTSRFEFCTKIGISIGRIDHRRFEIVLRTFKVKLQCADAFEFG